MSLIPESTLLDMLKALGAEQFEGLDGTFWALFDSPYASVSLQDDIFESKKPLLTARTSDLEAASVTEGSEVTRVSDGAVYRVTRPEPDGEGLSQMRLNIT